MAMRMTFAIAAVLSLFAVTATGAFAECAGHLTTASSSQTVTSDNAPMTKIKTTQQGG
jgi:hypothetical protein